MREAAFTKIGDLARRLVARQEPAIAVSVVDARGSTPREAGSWMAVTETSFAGTIGGGRLEWLVLERARAMLSSGSDGPHDEAVPLGPEINQCCGGHVTLRFERLTPGVIERLEAADPLAVRPQVQIHGAGHTGVALADALSLLPLDVTVIDQRSESLEGVVAAVRKRQLALPEQAVREAAPGTAFVVLTHSHDLDFLISAEALSRGDAAYVGMIGSVTKRAVFERWLKANGYPEGAATALTCPIGVPPGGAKPGDKRPEIIAALTAAELAGRLFSRVTVSAPAPQRGGME